MIADHSMAAVQVLMLLLILPLAIPRDALLAAAATLRELVSPQPKRKAWQDLIHMKGDAPEADPMIGVAAVKSAQTGEAWLSFAKDAYASLQERQKGIDKVTGDVVNQQLDTAKEQQQWAEKDRAMWDKTFAPLLASYADTATDYGSQANQEAAAAEAKADVQKQAASERLSNDRQTAALGISPASGRGAAISRATELGTALASAGAQNNARSTTRDKGLALTGNAIGLGSGLLGQSNAATGLSLNAGNSATGNTTNAAGTAINSTGVMSQGFSGAQQGYGQEATILNQLYQSQLQGWQAQQQETSSLWGGLGQLAGIGLKLAIPSSKKLKTNKEKLPEGDGIKALNKMPVEKWDYKPGEGDGGKHIGPYAEDMASATGVGDGKVIKVQDALGITMKAVQDIDKKVSRIERAVGIARRAKATPVKKAA